MQLNGDQSQGRNNSTTSYRRVTVQEAARILGITPEAVRSRAQRGTLVKEKDRDGTVYIRLDDDRTRTNGDGISEEKRDRARSNDDKTVDEGQMVEVLQEQMTFLRGQLDQEREANRENRRIIAGLVQRVPELEAVREPREVSEAASEGAAEDKDDLQQGQQETPRRRSWLYRFFFGP